MTTNHAQDRIDYLIGWCAKNQDHFLHEAVMREVGRLQNWLSWRVRA